MALAWWGCAGIGGGAIYVWDYATWIALFPEFTTTVSSAQAQLYFNLATDYLNNDGSSPVFLVQTQGDLLNLLTAHIAQLLGSGSSPIVGRISNASEGSVSVGSEFPMTPTNAWFMQSKYGAMFWQATVAYRTMRYIPGPQRVFNPFPLG